MNECNTPPGPRPPARRYALQPTTIPDVEMADDAQAVFAAAIEAGHLTDDPRSPRYAGEWMYMHHQNGKAAFKYRFTRRYRFFPV